MTRARQTTLLAIFALLAGGSAPALAGGSIHNHLTLDLLPLIISANTPIGSGFGISYDRFHDALRSSYVLSTEFSIPYASDQRTDAMVQAGFFTEVTRAFSVGARIGIVVNQPGSPSGFGALGLRLPALFPEQKEFLSFFFEEIDLGVSGSGDRYAAFRLGLTLF